MKDLVRAEPVALIPTSGGAALFLGDPSKTLLIYIERGIGDSINSVLSGQQPARPASHDVTMMIMESLGGTLSEVVIHDFQDDVFYARLSIQKDNQDGQKELIKIDVRPSDALALAVRQRCPIYFSKRLWEDSPDRTEILNALNFSQ